MIAGGAALPAALHASADGGRLLFGLSLLHAQLVERLTAATAELDGLDAPPNAEAGYDGSAPRCADPLDHFMSGNRTQRSVERRAEVRTTRARSRVL